MPNTGVKCQMKMSFIIWVVSSTHTQCICMHLKMQTLTFAQFVCLSCGFCTQFACFCLCCDSLHLRRSQHTYYAQATLTPTRKVTAKGHVAAILSNCTVYGWTHEHTDSNINSNTLAKFKLRFCNNFMWATILFVVKLLVVV